MLADQFAKMVALFLFAAPRMPKIHETFRLKCVQHKLYFIVLANYATYLPYTSKCLQSVPFSSLPESLHCDCGDELEGDGE